ncbi:NADP-dependent oxidoreductase domain-containing protein [Microdochium bolleyi]|uniref:NADP-dependent oxidoreductase domain-containing protein n=1 Tax=Microdochium bolleyi TaxID=196109 RepID=A0A136JGC8_9PEZI|nr:NADP-dependent oxidoreductase domain-containing protein [Microdochium bolleyi]
MAISNVAKAKSAHVNMMTDTILNNMEPQGLRIIMRSLLAAHPEITGTLEAETTRYIHDAALPAIAARTSAANGSSPSLGQLQNDLRTVRCMLGCGLVLQSLSLLATLVSQACNLALQSTADDSSDLDRMLAATDGDVVQTMTAIEKTLFTAAGSRKLTEEERASIMQLYQALLDALSKCKASEKEYPFERAVIVTASLLNEQMPVFEPSKALLLQNSDRKQAKETFVLNGRTLPRIFSGLWQLSSPAWGSAPTSKIIAQFSSHVASGFTAFDMADHYGDAEILVGKFLSSYPSRSAIFAATKYCVFHPMKITREAVQNNITERCRRLQVEQIDLLQFHWQFYNDPGYLDAIRFITQDKRVAALGLCNFDTEHMEKTLQQGVKIHSNQVQFSLIDSRPTVRMGKVCETHDVKLLTYGTLCGGFLSEKWLDQPEPSLYDEAVTPSQRKYYGVIRAWGDWTLFQELLRTLKSIATKHSVDVSNVATRWVLDFPYVGAVIVGARMGISEHTNENLASFGWRLDEEDQAAIDSVLGKSRRLEMFEAMGDCGGEYR